MNKPRFDFKGILWDLDNTLYRTEEDLLHAFNQAIARAAIDNGLPLPLKEATELARRCFDETGYSGYYFIHQYGIDRDVLHYSSHRFTDEKIITKSVEVTEMFGRIETQHALITHGARDWAMRVLLHLDLLHWFPHEHIHALEDFGFEKKSASPAPFVQALAGLGLAPGEAVMVEDTIENLRLPREMGLTTVFLTQGRKPDAIPPYVDHVFENTPAFLRAVEKERARPIPN